MAVCEIAHPTSTDCDQPVLNDCPICHSRRVSYAFSHDESRVVRCPDCRFMFLNPQPTDAELGAIYTANYFLGAESEEAKAATRKMKGATAAEYLKEIERYSGMTSGQLLEIGCGDGDFLVAAERAGFTVTGVEYSDAACAEARRRLEAGTIHCGELAQAPLEEEQFDLCVLNDVIEHVRDPIAVLDRIHRLLKPNGMIFITTPSLTSWSARLMKENWVEWKREHLSYFDPHTIQTALHRSSFHEIIVTPGRKVLTLDYIVRHLERYPVALFTSLFKTLRRFLPEKSLHKHRNLVASGMMVFARKKERAERPKLSVVVPAYNEAGTFRSLMNALLKKRVEGLDLEIVIVESGSTDGTRELVCEYRDTPRVKVVLEDKPRGKGHAVRAGFAHATGDFILIQDADLEYDLEDYDTVLEPLVSGREAFTLGARHGGGAWKMRQFTGQPLLSSFLNLGHSFFTMLVNVLFGQKLRDPFTMYKVFRRDCLFGLHFECNRFDFDYELLVKLLRKGYRVLELPVNYRSRSFKEGKKVSMVSDPLSWLKVCAKLRFTTIDPMAEVERSRQSEPSRTGATNAACPER